MASVENMEAVSEHAHSTPIHHNGHEMASELHSLPPTSSTQSQSPPTAKFIDPIVPSPTCSHRQTLGNTRVQKVKSSRGTGQTQKPPTHTRRPPKARCHPLAESYAGAFPKDPIQRYLNARRLGWDPKPPPGFSLTTPQVSTKAPDADKRSLSSKLGDLSFNEFLERHRDSIQLHTDGKQQPDTATNLIHTLITANPQTQESIQLYTDSICTAIASMHNPDFQRSAILRVVENIIQAARRMGIQFDTGNNTSGVELRDSV